MTDTDIADTAAPGRPRSRAADKAILAAALDLLIERGAGATSIEQVAQRAGVTRATIYRRFAGKTELLVAALESLTGATPPLPDDMELEDMIASWGTFVSMPRMRLLLRRLFGTVDDYPQLQRAYRDTLKGPFQTVRLNLVGKARRAGHLPADTDPELLLEILAGAIWNHLAEYPDDSSADSVRAYLMAVLRQAGYRRDHKQEETQ